MMMEQIQNRAGAMVEQQVVVAVTLFILNNIK
jgi:hypothetical protein